MLSDRVFSHSSTPITYASFSRFLRVNSELVDPQYLFWYLQYLYKDGQTATYQVQHTGVARFQYTNFAESISIRLPELQEQRAIAHVLGTLDDKIELNRRLSQTLEELARTLFTSWFVTFDPVRAKAAGRAPEGMDAATAALFPSEFVGSELGPVPRDWSVCSLSDICTTKYGYTASATDEPIGPKFLRVTDINKVDWIEWERVPFCRVAEKERLAYGLVTGDILVARMADPGKSAIVDEEVEAIFASYLVRLKTTDLAHAYYVFRFLKSDQYRAYAAGARSGSVQANMNARVIVGANLVLPPKQILDAFLSLILPLRQQIAQDVRQTSYLARLRDDLMTKLLSGVIQLREVEDLATEMVG